MFTFAPGCVHFRLLWSFVIIRRLVFCVLITAQFSILFLRFWGKSAAGCASARVEFFGQSAADFGFAGVDGRFGRRLLLGVVGIDASGLFWDLGGRERGAWLRFAWGELFGHEPSFAQAWPSGQAVATERGASLPFARRCRDAATLSPPFRRVLPRGGMGGRGAIQYAVACA